MKLFFYLSPALSFEERSHLYGVGACKHDPYFPITNIVCKKKESKLCNFDFKCNFDFIKKLCNVLYDIISSHLLEHSLHSRLLCIAYYHYLFRGSGSCNTPFSEYVPLAYYKFHPYIYFYIIPILFLFKIDSQILFSNFHLWT